MSREGTDPSEGPTAPETPVAASSLPALPESPSAPGETASALTRYMAQLRHHAPISREEEHALALRWIEEGDVEAARQLVLSNIRLVVKIAMEYRRSWTNVLDLIQEGNVGLMQAVQRFDPYQEVKLSTYAAYWIRAFILKYLIDNIRMVRLGSSRAQRKLFFRLNKEKRELERQGYQAEPKLIAERLDVSEADVIEMEQRLGQSDLSIEAPMGDEEGGASLGDFLAAAGATAEQNVGDEQLRQVFREKLRAFTEELDERDRRIVEERVLAETPKTLQEMGDIFGVSRERVRQLEARIVDRLRDYFKKNLVDFEYYAGADDG